jgi:threonine/homoserine/homoserine lactone efflux protein
VSDLFRLSRWKPRHLLAAWSAYWVGLIAVTLGPAIVSILRVTVPAGAKGDASVNFGDGALNAVIHSNGATLWSVTAKMVTIALWLAGPPLLIWLAWLVARPSRQANAVAEGLSPSRRLGESTLPLQDRDARARQAVDRD